MNTYFDTFKTSAGAFSIAVDASGSVVATAFGDESALRKRMRGSQFVRDSSKTKSARNQVLEYFAGRRQRFELSLAPQGTAFQRAVWSALQKIPFGQTRSYGELAKQLKRPGAARAVGRANATNPVCLIVPCHRVIGIDGSLTGFAFGEPIKRQLLDHEAAPRAAAA